MTSTFRSAGLILGMSFLLSACGGGGGGGTISSVTASTLPTPGNVNVDGATAGIWTGSYTDASNNSVSIVGGIAPDGTSVFLDYSSSGSNQYRLYTFTSLVNNLGTTSGTLRHFVQQGTGTQGSASNVVDEAFTGTFQTGSYLNGSTNTRTLFQLTPSTVTYNGTTINRYDLPVSSSDLASKTFGGVDDAGNNASIKFDATGVNFTAAVQFTSTSGCSIQGKATQVSGHNLFEIAANVTPITQASTCDTGGYIGLMFFADTSKKAVYFGLVKANTLDNGTVIAAVSP